MAVPDLVDRKRWLVTPAFVPMFAWALYDSPLMQQEVLGTELPEDICAAVQMKTELFTPYTTELLTVFERISGATVVELALRIMDCGALQAFHTLLLQVNTATIRVVHPNCSCELNMERAAAARKDAGPPGHHRQLPPELRGVGPAAGKKTRDSHMCPAILWPFISILVTHGRSRVSPATAADDGDDRPVPRHAALDRRLAIARNQDDLPADR